MKIGILGVGNIGTTLANRLASVGHHVKVANSRGPETLPPRALSTGATGVTASEVVVDVQVLVTSVPFARVPEIRTLIELLPDDAVVIDTSNYYPHRDGNIDAVDRGQVESLWVSEQFGRRVTKAWNAIFTGSFDSKAVPPGDPARVAIPVAGDNDAHRAVAMSLVNETGFDAFDAGLLENSWRQQPGTPAFCTDHTKDQISDVLAAADISRSIRRRDLMVEVNREILRDPTPVRPADYMVQLHRVFNT
ncbi:NADPH-dependent F420 reductase [Nocardia sp. NPDC127606]|uniref:NADPH-dependent F420 reductase n=1 Tax=Nocardia sp. NPDC127606 TaxID=3345406 RepID=UPI0036335A4F